MFLGLGTNTGDRGGNLRLAAARLSQTLSDLRLSPVYETNPLEYEEQPPFLNACAAGLTDRAPRELLVVLQEIEAEAGRNRADEIRKGPRPLDIDILLYGTRVLEREDLILPHPRLTERAFALRPLLDLAPRARDPRSGVLLSDFLSRLPAQGIYLAPEQPYTPDGGRT